MYFPEPVYDAYSGLNVQSPGCVHLDGVRALQVVRARHLQYKAPGVTSTDPTTWPAENQSDLARIRRDHDFLPGAGHRRGQERPGQPHHRLPPGLWDRTPALGGPAILRVGHGQPDQHLPLGNANSAPQLTMPCRSARPSATSTRAAATVRSKFPARYRTNRSSTGSWGEPKTDTMHGGKLPFPSTVSVSVLNGSAPPTRRRTPPNRFRLSASRSPASETRSGPPNRRRSSTTRT